MAAISPEIIKWCGENGFTDPQVIAGEVWAFKSMSVMPVPTGKKVGQLFPNSFVPERPIMGTEQMRGYSEPRSFIDQFSQTRDVFNLQSSLIRRREKEFCINAFTRKPETLTIVVPNPVTFSINNAQILFGQHNTKINFEGFVHQSQSHDLMSQPFSGPFNFNVTNSERKNIEFRATITNIGFEHVSNNLSCRFNMEIILCLI